EGSPVTRWVDIRMKGQVELVKNHSSLAEDLSHMGEDQLIALLANAVAIKRERASKERNTCETCGHPNGVHNLPCNELMATSTSCHACFEAVKGKPLSLTTECACGHSLNYHKESHDKYSKGCLTVGLT